MLYRRRINIRPDTQWLKQPLIRRETLEDCGCVDHLLEQANQEAERLLTAARAQGDSLLTDCEQSFWQQANTTLEQWGQERQAMWNMIEARATSLVEQMLARVLDQVPPADQMRSMLKELTRVHRPALQAEIHCHPSRLESLQVLLEEREWRCWCPMPDEHIDEDALRLETDSGHFLVSWQSMKGMLEKGLKNAEDV